MAATKVLRSTPAIFGGALGGILLGVFMPEIALHPLVGKLGDLYLNFLRMCVLPIIAASLMASLAKVLYAGYAGTFLTRTVGVFALALVAVSVLGVIIGAIGRPGANLSGDARSTFGKLLVDSIVSPTDGAVTRSLQDVLLGTIPSNPFEALSEANTLQIVFFSLTVGIFLGMTRMRASDDLVHLLELISKIFERAISAALLTLPFALLVILASQTAQLSMDVVAAMTKLIALLYIGGLVIILGSMAVVQVKLGISPVRQLVALKEPLIVAFTTRSSISAMPSVLRVMGEDFRLNQDGVHLVIPLAVLLCKYSMVLTFAVTLVFIAQVYFLPLGPIDYVVIALAAVLASMATVGMPGLVGIGMLGLVAEPLGLPFSAISILILATFPIIDPGITVANVYLNVATGVIIAGRAEDAPVADEVFAEPVAIGS
ncbi:MAG: dicarboxylate/amino acid:cation symporter [Dehalococcoidia bacterium]